MAKRAFIGVAAEDYGVRGRETNTARIAVMTGLTRREVARLRTRETASAVDEPGYASAASRVLTAWHLNPRYLDAQGRPLPLQFQHEAGAPPESREPSFLDLVRESGADVPGGAMLKQLMLARAVERRADGVVMVLKRNYMPLEIAEDSARYWASVLADHAAVVTHNFTSSDPAGRRFERRALSRRVATDHGLAFRSFVEAEGQAFLERIDAWLSNHEAPQGASARDTIRVGVGVYEIGDEFSANTLQEKKGST